MSETKQRSINAGPPPLLLGVVTDGAGGLIASLPQRGSSADAAGDASAWTIVDGPAGRLQCTLGAGVAGSQMYFPAPLATEGSTLHMAQAFLSDPTTIEVRVVDVAGTAVNLDTTQVQVQLAAHQV